MEQQLINQFHNIITTSASAENCRIRILPIINRINDEFPNSYILHYYIGEYYNKIGNIIGAENEFLTCINISPYFTPPYFPLCDIYEATNREEQTEQLLLTIFNRKTLDVSSSIFKLINNYETDVRICSILGKIYHKKREFKKMEKLYNKTLFNFKLLKNIGCPHIQTYKNIYIGLGTVYMNNDPEKAYEYYLEGLKEIKPTGTLSDNEKLLIKNLDKELIGCCNLSALYIQKPISLPNIDNVYDYYRINSSESFFSKFESSINNINNINKIRIGYISPDINKNAVSLFCTALFKYYDKNKFEVYCYYNKENYDEFTHIFKSYVGNNWYDIFKMNDENVYKLIKSHKIDILVDLAGHGIDNRLSALVLQPAPIIINYLGFPATTNLKEITHRIGDRITDPDNEKDYSEKMIYMPRCFICYTLFETVNMPIIDYNPNNLENFNKSLVHIGIFNKSSKQNLFIRNIWKSILSKNKNAILCIKLDNNNNDNQKKMYEDIGIPKNQLKFFEFTDTLDDYLKLFNSVDFCIDTYPYSGTTTTCSALLMGVPTFTIYKGAMGKHVNNVSASILKCVSNNEFDKYICNNVKEYKERICDEIKNISKNKTEENKNRLKIREQFLKAMEPNKFMREYEIELLKLVN